MPLVCEPGATFAWVFPTDAGKPEPRPRFLFRYVSARVWRQIIEITDRLEIAGSGPPALDLVLAGIRMTLVSWENLTDAAGLPIPWDPDRLEDILTPREALLMLYAGMAQQPDQEDKKKLDLPPGSEPVSSVPTAPGSEIAGTSPAPTAQ